jgi:hypothetical protein
MMIHDYIKKHGLELWRRVEWPTQNLFAEWMPSVLVDSRQHGARVTFEIYSDKDYTHFVSLNLTKEVFRIVHMETGMAVMAREWIPIALDYEAVQFLDSLYYAEWAYAQ